jgi:hypothetical protein
MAQQALGYQWTPTELAAIVCVITDNSVYLPCGA